MRDPGIEREHVAIGEGELEVGLFADGEQLLGADVEPARGQILGLGDDGSRRALELDATAADQSLIATSSRSSHQDRKFIGQRICCLVYAG